MPNKNRALDWLVRLPTTQLTVCVTLSAIVATTVRYLFVRTPLQDFGQWLTFLAGLATIGGATVVGKRYTTDPAVITAEAAARQTPAPDVTAPAADPPAGEV